MFIWSEILMGQYRDEDRREHAPHFSQTRKRVRIIFDLKKFIAMSEIFLMPIIIYFAFTGAGFFTPIFYYRFIVLRYTSERNPYKYVQL